MNCFIIHSRKFLVQKHSEKNIISSIDVNFIFDSAQLELFSSANILQTADVAPWVVFLLFLPCF